MTPSPKTPEPSAEELLRWCDEILEMSDGSDYQVSAVARALRSRLQPAPALVGKEIEEIAKRHEADAEYSGKYGFDKIPEAMKQAHRDRATLLKALLRQNPSPAASVGVTRERVAKVIQDWFCDDDYDQDNLVDWIMSLLASSAPPTQGTGVLPQEITDLCADAIACEPMTLSETERLYNFEQLSDATHRWVMRCKKLAEFIRRQQGGEGG